MKIKIDKKGSKEFYNEFYYVVNNRRKFINYPNRKVKSITTSSIMVTILSLILTIVMYFIKNDNSEAFSTFVFYLWLFITLFLIVYSIYIIRLINKETNTNKKVTFDFKEDEIVYESNDRILKIKWENVSSIVVSKNSITILNKDKTGIIMGLDISYKEEVYKILEKYNKKDLIVDTTN